MKKIRNIWAVLLCLCMAVMLIPGTAMAAADQPVALTVDGTDAFETPKGDGWEFDEENMTLTLNGYDGGKIVAHCNLTVILAEGSTNTINTAEGTALGNGTSFGTTYTLDIRGEGVRPVLNITGAVHAIHATGSITIENCDIKAVNQSPMSSSGDMECIQSEFNLTVKNSSLDLTSNGVGLTCFDHLTITDSDITVNADIVGIHANNEGLVISGTALNVTGKSNGALQSRFGGVYLTSCTGELNSDNAGIIAKNLDGDEIVEIKDTNLEINAATGVQSYGDINVENGSLILNSETGLVTTKEEGDAYTTDVHIKGDAAVGGDCGVIVKSLGAYTCEETASVNGIVLSDGDSITVFSGKVNISEPLTVDKPALIAEGAEVTVEEGTSLDFTKSPEVIIAGALKNCGTVLIDGDTAVNRGTITNNGAVTVSDGTALKNEGKIVSICSRLFPVDGNGIEMKHNLDTKWSGDKTHHWHECLEEGCPVTDDTMKDGYAVHTEGQGVVTTPATETEKGVMTYSCSVCGKVMRTEEIPTVKPPVDPEEPDDTKPDTDKPEKPGDPNTPQTGDSGSIVLWTAATLAGAAGISAVIISGRKRRVK